MDNPEPNDAYMEDDNNDELEETKDETESDERHQEL